MDRSFRIDRPDEFRRAGPTDLVRLPGPEGGNALYVTKWKLEALAFGIVDHKSTHLSGPTGTAKSSLLKALCLHPDNLAALCRYRGVEERPVKLYAFEMATFDSPGEIHERRALEDGGTYDEWSVIVSALIEAQAHVDDHYVVCWLMEIGRCPSAAVQGGLLDLMFSGEILLSDGSRLDVGRLAWVADSNYQAEGDSTHTLVAFDDGLRRRFNVNLTLDYLSEDQEAHVVAELRGNRVDPELVQTAVRLGTAVRRHRAEGALRSLAPPTIHGHLAFVDLAEALPHLSLQHVAQATLLGNASPEDQKVIPGVLSQVLGIPTIEEDDPSAVAMF